MNKDKLFALRTIFAAYLGDARQKGGLTRKQVAENMGIDEEIIEEWEAGKRNIDPIELCAFCQTIGPTLGRVYRVY